MTEAMVSGNHAVEFLEGLPDMLPQATLTPQFCDEYERVMNRIRYECSKGKGLDVLIQKRTHGTGDLVTCRNCGFSLGLEGQRYCENCGKAQKWPSAGERYSERYSKQAYREKRMRERQ